MKKDFFFSFIFVYIFAMELSSQCYITVYANGSTSNIEICPDDLVLLQSIGDCPGILYNNFNIGGLGSYWTSSNQDVYTNPCAPHSPDGTVYLWMGSSSSAPRSITTPSMDVSQGGQIQFEMRFSVAGGSSPCNGPDLYNEGVALTYSIDGGYTWNNIEYYAPNGDIISYIPSSSTPSITSGTQTQFTTWATYNVAIPPAAQTSSTRFRFTQYASTSQIYDHWGLDNITVSVPITTFNVSWSHGSTVFNPGSVFPTHDSTFFVNLSFGSYSVQDSVLISVVNNSSAFSAPSLTCLNTPVAVTYTGNAPSTANYMWNFDGATVISGSGQGAYYIYWTDPGTYTISLAIEENGCFSDVTYFNVNVSVCSGIEKSNNLNGFIIKPNPASDIIIIENILKTEHYIISIFDIQGQLIFKLNGQTIKHEIDISGLAEGMYFLMIQNEEGCLNTKIIKK